ncbi:MAG: hypothetical protein K8R58_07680 [Bacteroidales bacterium]|nr:hypothetical protein [Bacteroidales bacterium]
MFKNNTHQKNDTAFIMKENNDFLRMLTTKQTNDNNLTSNISTHYTIKKNVWKILIVDNDESIHSVIRTDLKDLSFQNRKVQLLNTFSVVEAKSILQKNNDIALILINVIMDNNAGIEFTKYIREYLNNKFCRIIFIIEQPSQAPEKNIIELYQIDDYKTKAELTSDKLYTVILTSLRTYEAMLSIESYRSNIEKKIISRTKELETQKKELQELNATKDKLFSILAHDLRSQIGNFKTVLDILLMKPDLIDKETTINILTDAKHSANYIFELLENILYWARLQKKEIKCKPENIEINQLIEENIKLFIPSANCKNIKLQLIDSNNLKINADKNMIIAVLRNLISNAVKFTDNDGRITIKSEKKDDYVEVSIIDTGVGISKDNLKKMFKPDIHFTTKGTAQEIGSGLGLILCKDFIEKNGGKIWVDSQQGKGSTFKFTIPKNN